MRSASDLERLYSERPSPPRERGTIDLIVRRIAPGKHETPRTADVSPEQGLVGDRWSSAFRGRDVGRQLTLMMTTVAELVCDGLPLDLPGDNLLVNFDLGTEALPIGTPLLAGGALLEVSDKPHTGCKKFRQRFGVGALDWVNDEAGLRRKLRGINCRVLRAGELSVGDIIQLAR